MLSGQTWSILALIFIWRSYCHQSIHHAGSLLWQRGSSFGQCFIIGPEKLPRKQPNAVNKTFPATPALRAFLDFLAFPLKKKQLFDPHRRALPFLEWAQKKRWISASLFPCCSCDIPKYVIQIQPGSFQGDITHRVCQFPLRPLYQPQPAHSLSLCLPPSIYHSPSLFYLSASHFPVCWRMNCQRCLQYQLLRLAREQRTERWNHRGVEHESSALCISFSLCVATCRPVLFGFKFWSIISVCFSHLDVFTDM